jgi:hypothetical protein
MRVILLLGVTGCHPAGDATLRVVDLASELGRAEQRPSGAFVLVMRDRPAILAPAPGRLTWELPLPHHGRFRAAVALDGTAPVRFRVGVSDDRVYEKLVELTVSAPGSWTALDVDLGRYAGWKWSLFYHPDAIVWHLLLSTDAVDGSARGLWGGPEIVTDHDGAVEYEKRRRATRSAAP